jgi:predicted DNA-binding protein with PD1-like motif
MFKSLGLTQRFMRCKLDGSILFIKLDDGEDFLGEICRALESTGSSSGVILSCVGMMREIVLAYFKGEYIERALPSPMEIVSVEGNIAQGDDGSLQPHIHVALADESLKVYGGHLRRATVHNTAEIAMLIPRGVSLVKRRVNSRIELFIE